MIQAYRVIDTAIPEDEQLVYFRHTLAAAHHEAKHKYTDEARPDVRIQLIEIPTTALSVIDYLNGQKPVDPTSLRTWKLTPRGGLMELNADGSPAKDSDKGVL